MEEVMYMSYEENLRNNIEFFRTKMNQLSKIKPLHSQEIVETSQYLDELMNKYETYKNQTKKENYFKKTVTLA
jgi:hypothetical protein